ncbi:MAG TPA: cytochrome C [Candidatus Bathyarchaeia archaeon]|nr:cytochrome C [Candidatus Bathyarchaeia archaeon]
MSKKITGIALMMLAVSVAIAGYVSVTWADKFTKEDQERWQAEFMTVVQAGRELWTSPTLGTNGVACAQCHPNAANTHPETYPKFQQQLGKVIGLRDMINWCLQHPLEGKAIDVNDAKMVALEAYVTYERRGVALDPGKH